MNIISFNEAATANGRIEKFIENPDSNSGVLTQPKVIEAGETVTIKSGRQAVLANTVIEGNLVIEAGADVFVPAGAGFGDLESQISTLESTKQDNLVVNDPAVKTALNAGGTAPIYACRAWVNFNGTGTVAIRASGNVSSITDNNVGNYRVNFTTAMSDSSYSAVAAVGAIPGNHPWCEVTTYTTSSVYVYVTNSTTGVTGPDVPEISCCIFR